MQQVPKNFSDTELFFDILTFSDNIAIFAAIISKRKLNV